MSRFSDQENQAGGFHDGRCVQKTGLFSPALNPVSTLDPTKKIPSAGRFLVGPRIFLSQTSRANLTRSGAHSGGEVANKYIGVRRGTTTNLLGNVADGHVDRISTFISKEGELGLVH